jgi:hypothetical protein
MTNHETHQSTTDATATSAGEVLFGTSEAKAILMSRNSPFPLDDFITRAEVLEMLNISERTLQRLDQRREGPPKIRVGNTVIYRREAIRLWLISRETPSSLRRRR